MTAAAAAAEPYFEAFVNAATHHDPRLPLHPLRETEWYVALSREAWDAINLWAIPHLPLPADPTYGVRLFGYPVRIGEDLTGTELRIVKRQ